MVIDAVYGDKGKKSKHAKGKNSKDKGKHENSSKFVAHCGHCGKWRHKQKDCRCKNTVAEVDQEESVEPPPSDASSSTTRGHTTTACLSSAGIVQSTTGSISTLVGDQTAGSVNWRHKHSHRGPQPVNTDVTVRFFESDTRAIERAGFRVHSTWVSGNST